MHQHTMKDRGLRVRGIKPKLLPTAVTENQTESRGSKKKTERQQRNNLALMGLRAKNTMWTWLDMIWRQNRHGDVMCLLNNEKHEGNLDAQKNMC